MPSPQHRQWCCPLLSFALLPSPAPSPTHRHESYNMQWHWHQNSVKLNPCSDGNGRLNMYSVSGQPPLRVQSGRFHRLLAKRFDPGLLTSRYYTQLPTGRDNFHSDNTVRHQTDQLVLAWQQANTSCNELSCPAYLLLWQKFLRKKLSTNPEKMLKKYLFVWNHCPTALCWTNSLKKSEYIGNICKFPKQNKKQMCRLRTDHLLAVYQNINKQNIKIYQEINNTL